MARTDLCLTALSQILSPAQLITDPKMQAAFLQEWRGRFHGKALAVLLPETTQQVSNCLKIAYDHQVGVVPQGGNTGLVGGQMPDMTGTQLLLSCVKMNKISHYSPENNAMIVGAGVVLQDLHNFLQKTDHIFPISIASQQSAQIGGLIATNAGGISVVKYGNMRSQVIGVEAVLADGTLIDDRHYLHKFNKGFVPSHLFIGTEGVHGIITSASLRLAVRPRTQITAMISFNDIDSVLKIFHALKNIFATDLASFELIPAFGLQMVQKHHPHLPIPFGNTPSWSCLLDIHSCYPESMVQNLLEESLERLYHQGGIIDIFMAQNKQQADDFHQIRMIMSECQKHEGASIKHDISLPIDKIPQAIHDINRSVVQAVPDIRPMVFGHMGDGNLHYNFSQVPYMNKQDFMNLEPTINKIVFEYVKSVGGSFSAEHGIGQLRKESLKHYLHPNHYTLIHNLKKHLDPHKILNPDKMF